MTGQPSRESRTLQQRELAAARSNIEGFPEICKFTAQCRLCMLARTNPEVLHEIHEAWRSGKGVRILEGSTVETWKLLGQHPVDRQTFARHLRQHTDLPEARNLIAGTQVAEARRQADDVLSQVDDVEQDSDFADMRQIIEDVKSWVTLFRGPEGLLTANYVDADKLKAAVRLVGELRASIETFNRMKNSDRVTRALIISHTKRFVRIISPQIVQLLTNVQNLLAEGEMEAAAAMVTEIIGAQLGGMLREAAQVAVDESAEAYRLQ